MYQRDTIAAISTPVGEGGIGIVRVSGDKAEEIVLRIFSGKRSGGMQSHRFYYGEIFDPENGTALDEAMVVLMRAPNSYTREDVAEIQCHGGYLLVRKVLELAVRLGARPAEPGEFTKRAFLNGRIDLLQAEAVIDIIRGKTEASLALAQSQMEGNLSKKIGRIKEVILNSTALIEACIDFPEDDIVLPHYRDIRQSIDDSLLDIDELLSGFDEGKVIREGVSVLIAGKPNVGKSSLMNTLLKEKRAIVTSIPGTTRDIIEEVVNIRGLSVRLLDTAGIRDTEDEIEQEGMRLTMEKMPLADLILFVMDASRPFDNEDRLIFNALTGHRFIVVMNKTDLESVLEMPREVDEDHIVRISARDGEGIEALRDRIFNLFISDGSIDGRELAVLSQARHRDSLQRAKRHLHTFLENFSEESALEFVALDLREALNAIGEITGETTPDEILDRIFSRFCIGK
ncbi:MAG: tRNA uridine-5-carboxymethylaminomethyl(34) synthesis GTPase MnmE [Geobacteraceae bacterium]|nr:tRNA uridine-5-carboxymethylaminomethyl(34) synthesis GTPase MnmE [Geobacteraceae bacterium]